MHKLFQAVSDGKPADAHKQTHDNDLSILSHCIPQAYPEYLITYQILKPESTPSPTAGAEQKT